MPLIGGCRKALFELLVEDKVGPSKIKVELDFTAKGVTAATLNTFFSRALDAARKQEPIIESGNKYGVSDDFHTMNGQLIMHDVECSAWFAALSATDRERCQELMEIVLFNPELRNRNPLHPSVLDACVIGNLMNFPKHIFGMPFGCYGTDGTESLSLCLYSYRLLKATPPGVQPQVLYARTTEAETLPAVLLPLAERLGMTLRLAHVSELPKLDTAPVVVVLTSLESTELASIGAWAARASLAVHVHVLDATWRSLFTEHAAPMHFELPPQVMSLTIEEGLLSCGYSLYRDHAIRDAHFDVGHAWQTAYLSPNEGGSGASTPLYLDFCRVLLGWRALGTMARVGRTHAASTVRSNGAVAPAACGGAVLAPTLLPKKVALIRVPQGGGAFDAIHAWARRTMEDETIGREYLEQQLLCFQRHFLGGSTRDLEVLSTGGGTRSINLAFESVLCRAKACGVTLPITVITGNPHLAVERAERRFGFVLRRVDVRGALCVEQLKQHVASPEVLAVYSQSLSFTDGISDDVGKIIEVLEAENARRAANGTPLVTLINDSCLAFSVLVHNDGKAGRRSMRVLDLTKNGTTPTIVTLDAHKHLGTDKGVSTVVGSAGTLSHLRGHVTVGSQPTKGQLVRALADMLLVGVAGYYAKYAELAAQLERAEAAITQAGMVLVHTENRIKGSSVLAVEDRSSWVAGRLKKRGHGLAYLFNLYPETPKRTQIGWQLSVTPYALRSVDGERSALDVFLADLLATHTALKARPPLVASLFPESSLLANVLGGGVIEPYIFSYLWSRGHPGCTVATAILRRLFSCLLDSGVVCSHKRTHPLSQLVAFLAIALLALLVLAAALAASNQ